MTAEPSKALAHIRVPEPGTHTDEILRGLGCRAAEIETLRGKRIV